MAAVKRQTTVPICGLGICLALLAGCAPLTTLPAPPVAGSSLTGGGLDSLAATVPSPSPSAFFDQTAFEGAAGVAQARSAGAQGTLTLGGIQPLQAPPARPKARRVPPVGEARGEED